MTNNYQEPEVFEIGRAQDIVLSASKNVAPVDSITGVDLTMAGDIDESDE